jgi:hypothetical protein
MHNFIRSFITSAFIATIAVMLPVMAKDTNTDWEAKVRKVDDTYWHDFNFGTSTSLNAHLSRDVEFYHDL